MPGRETFLMLISAQGLTRMFAAQFAATLNKPDLKAPADLPKEPALFGFSLTPTTPAGYEFHLVVPGSVGPVVEKGMIPVFRSLQGNANP
jgi:hypothetical protein